MKIIKIPLQIYDLSAGKYVAIDRYFHSPKTQTDDWVNHTLGNQDSNTRLASSSEWFRGRQYLEKERPEEEKDFIEGPSEWTGTVLDYDNGELLEGIKLDKNMSHDRIIKDPYNAITSAKTRLGKQDGISLPRKSEYARKLGEEYTSLIQKLWGVKSSEELPDYAYLFVDPTGFKPVVRGRWGWYRRGSRRVAVDAGYGPALRGFAARLVSESRPENTITPEEYAKLLKQISERPVLVE